MSTGVPPRCYPAAPAGLIARRAVFALLRLSRTTRASPWVGLGELNGTHDARVTPGITLSIPQQRSTRPSIPFVAGKDILPRRDASSLRSSLLPNHRLARPLTPSGTERDVDEVHHYWPHSQVSNMTCTKSCM
ncbi:hypothetical protein BC628DRAFT_371332 [Trametes gibbosa]|nr:hypothetical protein BC628DRAFT_371332 [Trametes gibbosa]